MVSIHVPARGTTSHSFRSRLVWLFQSTFPQGERRNRPLLLRRRNGFNPRSRKGNDKIAFYRFFCMTVSIHVPARGTTTAGRKNMLCRGFQSTFPQGERRAVLSALYLPPLSFNPRSRKGNDISYAPRKIIVDGFNPRSRKGNDDVLLLNYQSIGLFQSTFPQGERQGWDRIQRYSDRQFQSTFPQGERRFCSPRTPDGRGVSIHVPARGTTWLSLLSAWYVSGFNPRSRKGNDDYSFQPLLRYRLFQSTFPQGERRKKKVWYAKQTPVSIHVPARGTTCCGQAFL